VLSGIMQTGNQSKLKKMMSEKKKKSKERDGLGGRYNKTQSGEHAIVSQYRRESNQYDRRNSTDAVGGGTAGLILLSDG
jgi:hypothetical protein